MKRLPPAAPMGWRRLGADARRLADARTLGALALAAALAVLLLFAVSALLGPALDVLPAAPVPVGEWLLDVVLLGVPMAYALAAVRRRLDPAFEGAPLALAARRGLLLGALMALALVAILGAAGLVAWGAVSGFGLLERGAGVIGRILLGILRVPGVALLGLLGVAAAAALVRTAFTGPSLVLEGVAPLEALPESVRRTRNRAGRVAAVLLPFAGVPLLAAFVLRLVPQVPGAVGVVLAAVGLTLGAALLAILHFHVVETARQAAAGKPGGHLVEARDLRRLFPVRGGVLGRTEAHVRAVDGVSLRIRRGATLGLVGESGCGKTTVGRTLARLLDATDGAILYDGAEVTHLEGPELRELRRKVQIVFQDPMSSLNPRMTVRQILREPLRFTAKVPRADLDRRVEEALERVGLKPNHADRYPHEFSGGQRQRIGIARALATGPEFVVLDEPTSALDVSVQAQVLNLLRRLQGEMGLTYLFISHDLSVVRHVCDEVAVMYLGRIVEQGPVDDVFRDPQHPYTQALLSAVPIPDPDRKAKRILLVGDVPSPVNPPAACRFHPRCPRAQAKCAQVDPPLEEKRPGQFAACHYPGPQERWPITQTKEVKVSED